MLRDALIALHMPAGMLAAAGTAFADAPDRAVPFVAVEKGAQPEHWASDVCRLAAAPCGKPGQQADSGTAPALYHAKGDTSGRYYAILPGPRLVEARFAPGAGWTLVHQWDVSDYQPANPDQDQGDGTPPPLDLFPALYPLGRGRFAVAILAGRNEMYSGGAGSWQTADFVALEPDGSLAPKPRVAGLPFSCSKSIRACFSEDNDRRSPHCSEDFDGTLHLRFAPRPSDGRLDWIATWKESHWPGLVARNRATLGATTVALPADRDPVAAGDALREKIPFCEPVD